MRGWLAFGLMCVLFLSGCAQPSGSASSSPGTHASGAPAAGTTAGATAGTTTGATASSHATGPNHAPTGALKANQTAGKAPLKVRFTLNATDADGDRLSYTLDFDGNGTVDAKGANATFPAGVNHTYAKPGVYNVTYTVTDGKNATSFYAKVNVTGGTAAPVVLKGSIEQYGLCGVPPGDDGAKDIDAALAGGTYTLTPASVYAWWWIGEGSSDPTVDGKNAGTVPKGTTSVHICVDEVDPAGLLGVSAGTDYVLTITPS
ncbi:MAG TPA: PKD domain-containing protein [Candidatus Thermoplasmatota archaeon]|nr:PKD domain-containing protein [Candidatus Thermoplasmatota archaeon]